MIEGESALPASSAVSRDCVVGIDLGTTNSLVAICDMRGPRILPDEQGRAMLPSVVRFVSTGDAIVGYDARDHAVEHPVETLFSVKRLMGRGFDDLREEAPHLPYAIVADERGLACVEMFGRRITPQEVSALILRELRQRAERALGAEVRQAVITVPAYFDDAQRQATRDAGRLAGLDVLRIVNEPTAAALAYGIGTRGQEPEIIAVYDLGGGTFDISILEVTPAREPGGDSFFQVLATAGDTQLGGDDVDRLIVDLVMEEIRREFGASLMFPPATRQALRTFSEAAKIRLSDEEAALFRIELGGGRVYERTLTREQLEAMMRPWVDRTIRACQRALKDAHLRPEQVDRVVMVGGSTRIPLVRAEVAAMFDQAPYTALDPDQVVALGAAVQGAIMTGVNREMLLLDVIPLSLGIETVGGAAAKLILRNTTIPARATEMFSTSVDNQTSVKIHVVQGERELVRDCRALAAFELKGIPPMPAGIPQIEVEFMVDANGILTVNARERRSGKRAAIQVVPRYGLTREEVDRMEAESIAFARADMQAHRVIDLAVNAGLDVKWIRAAMERVGDELDADLRAELEGHLSTVEAFIRAARAEPAAVDAEAFHRAKEMLDRASIPVHERSIARSLREE